MWQINSRGNLTSLRRIVLGLGLVISSTVTIPVAGDEAALREQVAQLKLENLRLRNETALLKRQLDDANRRIVQLESQVERSKAAAKAAAQTPPPDTIAKPAADPQARPEDAPLGQYNSAKQLLEGLPDDAAPAAGGWSRPQAALAQNWLTRNAASARWKSSAILRSISVTRDPRALDPDTAWTVTLQLQPRQYEFKGVMMTEYLRPADLTIRGDETLARRAEAELARGKTIELSGDVEAVSLRVFNERNAFVYVVLTNRQVAGFDTVAE